MSLLLLLGGCGSWWNQCGPCWEDRVWTIGDVLRAAVHTPPLPRRPG